MQTMMMIMMMTLKSQYQRKNGPHLLLLSPNPQSVKIVTKQSSLVKMKLVILLFGLSFAVGYEERYMGFNNCGADGWFCEFTGGKYEITYKCSNSQPSARVWVWTARLPSATHAFTVRDCKHLEVHMDCTKGLRNSILNRFNVINVTHLEILTPLLPGIFLHDNDHIPQVPPVFHIENVQKVDLFPGLFDKPGGGCSYKYVEMKTLSLVNVHIQRIRKELFYKTSLDKFTMKNVVIDAIDSNGIFLNGEISIEDTTFPQLLTNAMYITGENISFVRNKFRKIQTQGLKIRTKRFQFAHNWVEEIGTQGLDVLGAEINIHDNFFNHLETGALEKITPGYSPATYEIAFKFFYNFSDNFIKNINPGSLHFNWEVYQKVCSDVVFKNNTFDCSCINLGWISVSNGLGPKITKVKEFYDIYLSKDRNVCHGHNHCPLSAIITQIQDVCNNKTNVSSICASLNNSAEDNDSSTPQDWTVTMLTPEKERVENEWMIQDYDPMAVTEKMLPVFSYTNNQTSDLEKRTIPIWLVVVPVILALAAISLGMFMWWYKKKKQKQVITTIYKNEKGGDADSLIVINDLSHEILNNGHNDNAQKW